MQAPRLSHYASLISVPYTHCEIDALQKMEHDTQETDLTEIFSVQIKRLEKGLCSAFSDLDVL